MDRRLDYYIQEIYEMIKVFSVDNLVEFYNRTFLEEKPISVKDIPNKLSEKDLRTEHLGRIGDFEKDELIKSYNFANHTQSRRK